jgi:ABC transport system ATP-binding/permease protein
LQNVSFGYGDDRLIDDFSTTVVRGDRIGIIGPNGCGKSTLLRILLGDLAPSEGSVTLGTGLTVAYFDQQRAILDLESSVRDNVADGAEFLDIGGGRRHVVGYLGEFLFDPARVNSPVKSLSGGERNRLLLARLFARPANLLVLDEPTNDLDVETLELLESLIADYDGTLLLVSHDREFLDAVVTSIIAFEGQGAVREYVGGYSDWVRQRPAPQTAGAPQKREPARAEPVQSASTAGVRKLSFREQKELAALPDRIDALERRLALLQEAVSGPDFYRQEEAAIRSTLDELAVLEAELASAFERWSSLEERA